MRFPMTRLTGPPPGAPYDLPQTTGSSTCGKAELCFCCGSPAFLFKQGITTTQPSHTSTPIPCPEGGWEGRSAPMASACLRVSEACGGPPGGTPLLYKETPDYNQRIPYYRRKPSTI